MEICDQLLKLLGKPRATNGLLFMRLIQTLEERPILDYEADRHWEYYFPGAGISLQFDNKIGIFDRFSLFLRTFDTETNRPFAGELPFGINRDDSVESVESKLPGSTMVLKDYRFDVDLRPLVVQVAFLPDCYGAPGRAEKHLRMLTVDYVDAARNPAKAASLGYDVGRK